MPIDWKRREYDMQFFDFTANELCYERPNMMYIMLDVIVSAVINAASEKPDTLAQLTNRKEDVIQRLLQVCDEKVCALEVIDKKYFTVPPNIRLSSNDKAELCPLKCEMHEEQQSLEINSLKNVYAENAVMLAALQLEVKKFQSIKELVKQEIIKHNQLLNESRKDEKYGEIFKLFTKTKLDE